MDYSSQYVIHMMTLDMGKASNPFFTDFGKASNALFNGLKRAIKRTFDLSCNEAVKMLLSSFSDWEKCDMYLLKRKRGKLGKYA